MKGKMLVTVLLLIAIVIATQGRALGPSYASKPIFLPRFQEAGWYHIQSKVSDLYLDVLGGSKEIGGHIVQAAKHPDQVWQLIPAEAPGYFYIKSGVSGLFLDDLNGGKDIGNHIVQAVKHPDQVWKFIPAEASGYYYIQSKVSDLFLDDYGGGKGIGNHIVQAAKHPAQVWKLIPASEPAAATTVTCQPSGHPFARGHCSLIHVDNPEGWVRGKASLNIKTGEFVMVLGLETDHVDFGVKGKMKVTLRDKNNVALAVIKMGQEIGIPGKAPGRARIENFTFFKSVPPKIAARATSLEVDVEFTGKQFGLWGIPFEAVKGAVEIAILVASGG